MSDKKYIQTNQNNKLDINKILEEFNKKHPVKLTEISGNKISCCEFDEKWLK